MTDIPAPPETWPIIEHEPEHEPDVPPELCFGGCGAPRPAHDMPYCGVCLALRFRPAGP